MALLRLAAQAHLEEDRLVAFIDAADAYTDGHAEVVNNAAFQLPMTHTWRC